jgi:hypothetical protein
MQKEATLGDFDRQLKTTLKQYYDLHCTGDGAIKWAKLWEESYRKVYGELPITLERLIIFFANRHRYYHYSSYELQLCLQVLMDKNHSYGNQWRKKMFDELCENEKLIVKDPWWVKGVKFHVVFNVPLVNMFDGLRYHSLRIEVMDFIYSAWDMLVQNPEDLDDGSSQSECSDASSDSQTDERILEVGKNTE